MNTITPKNNSGLRKWIIAISIVIPIAVAALFAIKIEGVDFSFLPPIYAGINAATAALLIMALRFIKAGNVQLHQKTIQVALVLSVLFLLCYVAYHMTSDSTVYGDLDANGQLDAIEKSAKEMGIDTIVAENMKAELKQWYGNQVDDWKMLKTYRIQYALPNQDSVSDELTITDMKINDNLFICGDHLMNGSINAAMKSGRLVAAIIDEKKK